MRLVNIPNLGTGKGFHYLHYRVVPARFAYHRNFLIIVGVPAIEFEITLDSGQIPALEVIHFPVEVDFTRLVDFLLE